ncbi:YqgQ family protein [Vagococcus xieshaowenii]|uniref:DUF910 family protein n=1 Tax=Vagococcus xieshaowenii TaxID=2562451 RepID=A0AAJ5EGF2_9ENTE|nr:YqgQ family protein [Vagococcus xieshaowenii]QCA28302.1 DUF910 family protein [Vagococcus xieshaowenii]TFZ42310.1 DUF910 family protein [Vagococcus xieshaowenii]
MRTLYDVQQLLKRFGSYLYTGKRLYDIELMEMELIDLHDGQMLEEEEFLAAHRVLRREYEHELGMQQSKEE